MAIRIRFTQEQLSAMPLYCFVVLYLDQIHILPVFSQYDTRYVP